jgi:5-methylcytosine-specific restriction enzyme A
MLFTGEQGEEYGYRDGWIAGDVFLYTGEGRTGDMVFKRGNRAVRDHVGDGKDLHLFEYVAVGKVRYVGQMVCTGLRRPEAPDERGELRKAIVFELKPVEALSIEEAELFGLLVDLWQEPLERLRERAIGRADRDQEPEKQEVVSRSEALRVYVLRRADGKCEACGELAPFETRDGRPYLEIHHVRSLADERLDHPGWVAAVCPNCHRRMHHGKDGDAYNARLKGSVQRRELEILAVG